jgi:hypothetical protein
MQITLKYFITFCSIILLSLREIIWNRFETRVTDFEFVHMKHSNELCSSLKFTTVCNKLH